MRRSYLGLLLLIILAVPFFRSSVFAHGCVKCHVKEGVKVEVPSILPLTLLVDGKERTITLSDAYRFHGHACAGVTIAFRAIQHGINILYGSEIPEQIDLLVFSRIAGRGPLDLIDLLMKGDKVSKRTWPPVGMKLSRDKFLFTVMRKSTCEAVNVKLKPELFPRDFFNLKKKEKEKSLTSKEWDTLHTYMKDMILTFPTMPAKELFGSPQRYKVIVWGSLLPGEMDKHIKRLRKRYRQRSN
ncbi:MAG: hypothetical protein KAU38_16320 [Desulfobacterales bacterium]|nr:hypothetical protein [Desulfobacterales bacterium]